MGNLYSCNLFLPSLPPFPFLREIKLTHTSDKVNNIKHHCLKMRMNGGQRAKTKHETLLSIIIIWMP